MSEVGEEESLVGKTLLGKLRVLRLIGAGGMGAVYEVEHTLTNHHRALKVLHPQYAQSPEVVARFVREAGVAGTLRSEHVVETFDAGQLEDGAAYVLMEMLEGHSLADLLEARRTLEPAHAARLVWQACEGVAAAHDAGIVHRDLKPDNLFVVRRNDGRETVKLLDFGISKFTETQDHAGTLTAEGSMMGTPYYMSPEQAQGAKDVDARADVYALGVILYEAVSGSRPFDDESFPALVIKIYQGQCSPLRDLRPDLDPSFVEVVERAMNVDKEERYPSARRLQDALRPFVDEELPVRAGPPSGAVGLEETMPSVPPEGGAVPTPARPRSAVGTPEPTAAPARPGSRRALLWGAALGGVGLVAVVAAVALGGGTEGAEGGEQGSRATDETPAHAAETAPPEEPPAAEHAAEPPPAPAAVDRPSDAGAPAARAAAPPEAEQGGARPADRPSRPPRATSMRPRHEDRPSRAEQAGLDTTNPYGD